MGAKRGPKIKPLTDREKFNAERKTRGTEDEWKLVKGVWKLVKGK